MYYFTRQIALAEKFPSLVFSFEHSPHIGMGLVF